MTAQTPPISSFGSRKSSLLTIGGLFVGLMLPGGTPAIAQLDEEVPERQTNLNVMRDLAEHIGQRASAEAGVRDSDSTQVTVMPKETGWMLETSLVRGFVGNSGGVLSSVRTSVAVEFGIGELGVSYLNPRKSGIIGSTVVDRQVHVDISAKVTDNRSGQILLARTFAETSIDTIEVSEIINLENPNIKVTQGALPSEGFFTNLVEPIIVLGAVAVAVFLLFHVRS